MDKLTEAGLNSNINYYKGLQEKYAKLYREALRQETLLIEQRQKIHLH